MLQFHRYGPVQASVSVVPLSRRGVVVAANSGPTMASQSASTCALAGVRLRNAGRVRAGTSAPTARGPHTCRLPASLSVAIPFRVPPSHPVPSAASLLHWYDRHRRVLPWRHGPGETPDPYRVWLSEIMLQQTTVAAVIPYFERFLVRFPTVEALAAAEDEAVMAEWAGLGYYARARNLLACARQVAALGGFPRTEHGLRALPGIGVYTAAAVAAIAFGVPVVPVDGNVERVASRLFAIADPLPGAKPAIAAAAVQLGLDPAARARPSDFAQALFDLGATLCSSTSPACALCPLREDCQGHRAGIAAGLPRKAPKQRRPQRFGAHFLAGRCGRTGAAAPPAAAGPAGRDDGIAGHGVARDAMVAGGGARPCADAGGLAAGGPGDARVHPFRTGDRCLCRAGRHDRGGRFPASGWGAGEGGAAVRPSVMRKCVDVALSEG